MVAGESRKGHLTMRESIIFGGVVLEHELQFESRELEVRKGWGRKDSWELGEFASPQYILHCQKGPTKQRNLF